MRSKEIICDACEVEHTAESHQLRLRKPFPSAVSVIVYEFVDGWINVPLILTSGIDLCPKCSKNDPNLTALAKKVRGRIE